MNAATEDLGFEYQVRKSGEIVISRHGRQVTILRGEQARKLLALAGSCGESELQQLLARWTGNYKRGNEKSAAGLKQNLME